MEVIMLYIEAEKQDVVQVHNDEKSGNVHVELSTRNIDYKKNLIYISLFIFLIVSLKINGDKP